LVTAVPELTLPPRLDLSATSTLFAQLSQMAQLNEDCRLLAHEVASVGSACLQTLLAFDQALIDRGRRLTLIDPSQAMRDGMLQLGMESVMTRWIGKA
jgi:anti-anti-sigma regulatory factor